MVDPFDDFDRMEDRRLRLAELRKRGLKWAALAGACAVMSMVACVAPLAGYADINRITPVLWVTTGLFLLCGYRAVELTNDWRQSKRWFEADQDRRTFDYT